MAEHLIGISLAMIVRDGAATLRDCLVSAAPFVDEMVVVDTGSTDGSLEIAKAMGANVIEMQWQDDFSLARNLSLDACRSPWVLVLDADERLSPPQSIKLMEALADNTIVGYYLNLHNLDSKGNVRSRAKLLRLFRNLSGVRFRFPIHEQISEALVDFAASHNLLIGDLPLDIVHTGYSELNLEKIERNLRLLEQAVLDTPEEPYLWYNLGKTLTHPLINHPDEAHLALERSRALLAGNLTLAARAAYRSSLYEFIVNNLIRLGWQEVALAMADEATILNGPSFEFSYLRGILLLGLGRPEEAINAFKDAIDQPSATAIWNGGDARRHLAFDGLGQALFRTGRFDEGLGFFREALAQSPEDATSRMNLAEALRTMGLVKEAMAEYMELIRIDPGMSAAWRNGAKILDAIGLTREATVWKMRAESSCQQE